MNKNNEVLLIYAPEVYVWKEILESKLRILAIIEEMFGAFFRIYKLLLVFVIADLLLSTWLLGTMQESMLEMWLVTGVATTVLLVHWLILHLMKRDARKWLESCPLFDFDYINF